MSEVIPYHYQPISGLWPRGGTEAVKSPQDFIRVEDHDRVVAEQAQRIDGLDAMLRQARVWSEEKDKRIEALETALRGFMDKHRGQFGIDGAYDTEMQQARAALATHDGANEIHPTAQTGQMEDSDAT